MEQLLKARHFLGEVGWLAERPVEFRKAVLSRCRLSVLEKGASLYRIGDFPDGIYGVASGGIAAEIAPNESGPHFLHVFRAGSWFGEAALFDDGPRLVTMVATRPSQCLHLPRFELREIASMDPNTWRWLGVLSVAQLKLALGIIADLMIRPPGPRIAAILLRLAGVRLKSKLDGNSLELDVTQKELAHISNLSRATVGNQLDQMQADGLIRRNYGHLTLLDPSALRRLVAEGENEH
jgi:CRP/FNR family cyclic AMP-dependent transcriptional regulator